MKHRSVGGRGAQIGRAAGKAVAGFVAAKPMAPAARSKVPLAQKRAE